MERTRTEDTPLTLDEVAPWQVFLEEQQLRARELIRAHPVALLCGATALGFLLARLMRRED
jgi:hypothetical protein